MGLAPSLHVHFMKVVKITDKKIKQKHNNPFQRNDFDQNFDQKTFYPG
jgi:hypothetical protein